MQAKEVKENPSGELEVRTGGRALQEDGGYTSLVLPAPSRWHHKARSRISPVPALTSRQRRRILNARHLGVLRSSQNTAPGRAEGRCLPPEAERQRQVPPHVLSDWRWTGGWEGAAGSAGALGLRGESPARAVPACPLPCLLPHSTLSARSTGPPRIPHSCPSPQIRADSSPSLRCSGPPLHLPTTSAWEAPECSEMAGGWTPGLSLTCSPTADWPFGGKSSALPQHTCPHGLIWSMVMLVASVWLGVLLGV